MIHEKNYSIDIKEIVVIAMDDGYYMESGKQLLFGHLINNRDLDQADYMTHFHNGKLYKLYSALSFKAFEDSKRKVREV